MSEMVERVARAIFSTVEQNLPPGATWESCKHQARAAIAAMKDPTEEMFEAFADASDESGDDFEYSWAAAISAALEPAPA